MQALRNEVKDLRTENKQLRKVMEGARGTLRQSLADSSVCDRRPRPHGRGRFPRLPPPSPSASGRAATTSTRRSPPST